MRLLLAAGVVRDERQLNLRLGCPVGVGFGFRKHPGGPELGELARGVTRFAGAIVYAKVVLAKDRSNAVHGMILGINHEEGPSAVCAGVMINTRNVRWCLQGCD